MGRVSKKTCILNIFYTFNKNYIKLARFSCVAYLSTSAGIKREIYCSTHCFECYRCIKLFILKRVNLGFCLLKITEVLFKVVFFVLL